MTTRQFENLLPSLKIVDLTSNVCIDRKFSGKTEISEMISSINASCNYERPKNNPNEVMCEQYSKSKFGIHCYIEPDIEISSQDWKITSEEYPRIQSLDIYDYKRNNRVDNFRCLPGVNRFIRNLIYYRIDSVSVSIIGQKNFEGMVWLQELRIRKTFIETIPVDTFQGLIRLKSLDLCKLYTTIYETNLQSIQNCWSPKFDYWSNA